MDPIDQFLSRCEALAAFRGWKRSTLSTQLFNDGKRLAQLAEGHSDIGVRRLAEAETVLTSLAIRADLP